MTLWHLQGPARPHTNVTLAISLCAADIRGFPTILPRIVFQLTAQQMAMLSGTLPYIMQ